MKKNIIICICLLLAGFIHNSSAQTLPNPIRNYQLNNMSAADAAANQNGTINGSVYSFTDRFGVNTGAMRFGDNTYISTPGFFAGSNYTNGFTISFWTYIDQNISKNPGIRPWADNDPIFQAFYARKGSSLVNNTLLGFQRIRDRAVINRFTINQHNDTKDWGIWLWDPVNFTNRTGWYQIVLVYEKAKMTSYAFYPNGQSESMSHYFRLQDLQQATDWGLGNINLGNSPFRVLDDFKVFAQPLTREQVRILYSQEAVPGGMYRVSTAANESRFIHTQSRNVNPGARLELLSSTNTELTAPYQWVFEPVANQPNVYTIRMGYTDNSFVHLVGRSTAEGTRVETLAYNASFAPFYQWLVEPAPNGFFTIRSNANRNMYMHITGRTTGDGTTIEVLSYHSGFPQFYRWRLNLRKTLFELSDKTLESSTHLIVPSFNTFLENQPQNTNVTNADPIKIGRESNPNPPFSNWLIYKSIDDSYLVLTSNTNNRFWHPIARSVTNNNSIQVLAFDANNPNAFRWIFDRDVINRFGRRYEVRPAINQNLTLQPNPSAPYRQNSNLLIRQKPSQNPEALSWQLFPFRSSPPVNKQVYQISPGVYTIRSQANENVFLATQNFSFNNSARLNVQNFVEDRRTNFYWEIDYEKDSQGNPIRDGSYLVKFFGMDNRYIHTVSNSLNNSTALELFGLDRVYMGTYKMFIERDPDGSGSYLFRLAGNSELYMHLWGHNTGSGTAVELLQFNNLHPATYKWKLTEVKLEAPLNSGTYRLRLAAANSPQRFLHTRARSDNDGARLEILDYNPSFASHYSWIIEKQSDNTYTIRRSNVSNRYVHPVGRSISDGTRLEILSYSSDNARLYKWIAERGQTAGSYRFRLVDFTGRLMHTSGHSSAQSAEVEILGFNANFLQTYEWIPMSP